MAAVLLQTNPGGLLLYVDELSAWMGSMNQYNGGDTDGAFWLSGYDGGGFPVDRIGRGSIWVPNNSTSILGTITPSAMRKFAGKLPEDGQLQRLIPVMSTRDVIGENREPVKGLWERYCTIVENLANLRYNEVRGIGLSKGAQDVFAGFLEWLYEIKTSNVFDGAMKSHLSKMQGMAPRLMLLWHMIYTAQDKDRFPAPEIPAEIAEQVCALMKDWLLGHIMEFWTNVIGQSAHSEHVGWIAGYILAHDCEFITQRELQRHYKKWDKLAEQVKIATFNSLTDGCWTEPDSTTFSKHGVPRRHLVNPKVRQWKERALKERESREKVVKLLNSLGKQD